MRGKGLEEVHGRKHQNENPPQNPVRSQVVESQRDADKARAQADKLQGELEKQGAVIRDLHGKLKQALAGPKQVRGGVLEEGVPGSWWGC